MKRRTIGVMIGNANSPHTIEAVKGIREAAKQNDVDVIYFIGVHSSYFYREYFQNEKQEDYDYQSSCVYGFTKLCDIDALIIAYGTMSVFMNEKELLELQRRIVGIPTVYLEKNIEGPKVRYIVSDNYSGIKLIMEHMIKYHGYRKILYLSRPMGNYDAMERLRSYKDSMEEAGLSYDESMIAYGDFSESVSSTVNDLLDLNPDAEALVCANDTMALATYAVFEKRAKLYREAELAHDKEGMRRYKKHLIGNPSDKGIAVSGYDNIDDAASVDPPLTTVVQNPYSHGFSAVNTVLSIVGNPDVTTSVKVTPRFIHRNSCGCKLGGHVEFPTLDDRYKLDPETYAAKVSEQLTINILPVELNEDISNGVYDIIYEVVLRNAKNYLGLSNSRFGADEVLEDVKKFLNSDIGSYIPQMSFVSTFNDFMLCALRNAKDGPGKDILVDIESRISEYIYARLFSKTREELALFRNRTWFMPIISRDMANDLDSSKVMYRNAILKLKFIEIGDVYLFIMDESITHRRNDKWECPSELRLVAFSENGEITAYEPDEAPVVSRDNVINNYLDSSNDSYHAFMLSLYSSTEQYGVIVAKALPEDVLSLYCASIQISIALKYCEMAREQRKIQKELQHVVKEVEVKNEMLRSLSEYDQLTECYNRRGFLEKGLELIKENSGKEACAIFADLDHLKEINDKFGHSEGDFAIEHVAKNIKRALPDSAIIARLGGDEFVALFLLKEGVSPDDYIRNIYNISVSFNATTDKPYYVECSAGYSTFECSESTSLDEVVGVADSFLYEAKQKRRLSVVKSIVVY